MKKMSSTSSFPIVPYRLFMIVLKTIIKKQNDLFF